MQPVFGAAALKKTNQFVLKCGVIMSAAGIISIPFCKSFVLLLASLGILLPSGFAALAFGIVMGTITPGLPKNRTATVSGIVTASAGLGSTVFSPLIQFLTVAAGLAGCMDNAELKEKLRKLSQKDDMDLFGIGSVDRWDGAPYGHRPEDVLQGAKSVIVMGVYIPEGCVRENINAYNGMLQKNNISTAAVMKYGDAPDSPENDCGSYAEKYGIRLICPDKISQIYINQMINNRRAGRIQYDFSGFENAVKQMRENGAEAIVLADAFLVQASQECDISEDCPMIDGTFIKEHN